MPKTSGSLPARLRDTKGKFTPTTTVPRNESRSVPARLQPTKISTTTRSGGLVETAVPFSALTPFTRLFTAGGVPRPVFNDEAVMLDSNDWNKWTKLHKPVPGKEGSA